MSNKLLVVIGGPTASGKTGLAIKVASHFQTDIVSADSRQFYSEIPIGTAQPDKMQLAAVQHHFIGEFPLEQTIPAGQFAVMCREKLDALFRHHDVVVLTGGSGMFIDAVLFGVDELPEADPEIREQLNNLYDAEGITGLQTLLHTLDPEHYEKVDRSNPRRLIRALEVCLATGKPYSSLVGKKPSPLPWKYIMCGISYERDALYQRINLRVNEMISSGLMEEARNVFPKRHLNSLHTVGYSELFSHFEGKLTLEEAIELIKKNTRNYAKRQLTWFRRYSEMQWFSPDNTNDVITWIESEIQSSSYSAGA